MKRKTVRQANKITTIAVIILLLLAILFLCSCNARNCEYKRWDTKGNLVEQVRMGQANFLYWFGMTNFNVDTDKMDVAIGSLTERNDPNAPAVAIQALKTAYMP